MNRIAQIAVVAVTAVVLTSLLGAADAPAPAPAPGSGSAGKPVFATTQLTDKFYSEGAAIADFDKDGQGDINAGPFIYFGPDFKRTTTIYEVKAYDPNGYSQNFLTYSYDVDGDGWVDIIQIGWPGQQTWWYRNPGKVEGAPAWDKHLVLDITDNESQVFVDMTGDGKPELVCMNGGYVGYAECDWKNPTKPWAFVRCSSKGPYQRFTHGIGAGDVNGDGKMDLLEARGWWEQPASREGNPEWKHHQEKFGDGGAQMYAYDVDGDGDNDVVTSIRAHGFGLSWFEQTKGDDGSIKFIEHRFMDDTPEKNKYGVKFSQLHAIDIADVDGDGLNDIITGKRFWAHGPKGDAEPDAPAVIYWFKLTRTSAGVDFVPHLIHDNSGVGTQVTAGDLNGDGRVDIVVGNKKGTYVHIQQGKKVSAR